MATCANCGAQIEGGYRVCGHCGKPLAPGDTPPEIRRQVTIVQSDLKGSTALGEKLDPESLREVLTLYFDAMRAVFDAHGGTIEKIIGDAIVAVFGLPTPRGDDALRAVAAAYETKGALAELNVELEKTWGVRLVTRTGVASGEVVVGEASAGEHILTGPTVQVAGKLEQSAPPLEVLVAGSTVALVGDAMTVEAVEPVLPKGFTDPVPAYLLVGVDPVLAASPAPSSAPPEAADGGGVCPNCGEENHPTFAFCGVCGGRLAAPTRAQETRRTVTVVFSDLKATTGEGDPLAPEVLRDVMASAFEESRRVLEHHGATVEKFIGDAIMAVFGLPVRHEDDGLRAVRSALDMREALAALAATLAGERGIRLEVAIGVNTGEVVAGDASLGQRLVSGDTVNVAARLEQAAPVHQVLIGDLTYRLVRDAVTVEEVEPLTLKGKAEPVPAYRLISVGTGEAFTRRQDAPMVGREREMALLQEVFADAVRARACRSITVVGDAGVGKTRLTREFLDRVRAGSRVMRGRCLPYGEGITFWPIVEVVRGACGILDDDSPARARERIAELLGPTNEEVVERVGSIIGVVDAQFRIDELFWGIRRFLEVLGADRPAVVLVDDIHWAEPTFLDLIRYLLDVTSKAAVVILCTSRGELLERHADWGEGPNQQRIVLAPLSDAHAGLIVENLLGRAGLDEAVRARVVQAAEGNPLFVEQLLSMLIDNGMLRFEDDRWTPTGDLSTISIPPTIHALVASRLDQLPTDERAVIEPASVIGLTFAEAAVEALASEMVAGDVPTHLATIARKELVRPASQRSSDERSYRFQHLLIRDAAYQGLLKRSRAVFHERFVDWAERINRERERETEFEEILGYHLEQAYRYRTELGPLDDHAVSIGLRASGRLSSAGGRAMARGDFPAAANLLHRGARLLDERHPERPRLLISAGEAYMEIGEFSTADGLLQEAAELAASAGAIPLRTTAELVRLQLRFRFDASTSIDDVLRETKAGIETLDRSGDAVGLARAWRLLEMIHGTSGRYGEAAFANGRAIEHARRAHDRVMEMRLYASTAMGALYGPTPVPEAIARCEDVLTVVGDDRRARAVTLSALAQLRAMNGDFEQARDHYTQGRAILEELGLRFDAATMSIYSGPAELLAGDPSAAEGELRKDYDALDAMGERNYISTTSGLLAEALYRQGRFEEAGRYADFCREVAAPSDVYSQYLWRGIRGKLMARDDAGDDGIELASSGVSETRTSDDVEAQGNALMFLAEAQAAARRLEDAARSASEACHLFGAKGNEVSAARAREFAATMITGGSGAAVVPG